MANVNAALTDTTKPKKDLEKALNARNHATSTSMPIKTTNAFRTLATNSNIWQKVGNASPAELGISLTPPTQNNASRQSAIFRPKF